MRSARQVKVPDNLCYFLTFLAVYLATTSLLDAVADQKCGCLALRRVSSRQRLRALVVFLLYSFLLLTAALLLVQSLVD